jgi:predicted ATPase
MLTRIEVDGFKNLQGFVAEFGPFTCLAGPNGVGKSNLFDALRFLSLLCDHTLTEAALKVRGDTETSDFRDLFRSEGSRRAESFRIAVEMLVDPDVRDDFGRPARASSTFLRYEIEVGHESSLDPAALGRVVLLSETLNYITEGEAGRRLGFPHSATDFRQKAVVNERRTPAGYISVRAAADGQREIVVHADGGSRGRGQVAPADSAPRTIVGTSNTSATPTILAARREMQQWRFLGLEPSAMRRPSRFHDDPHLTDNGGNLPATLSRLAREAVEGGEALYAEVANRLARLVPISGLGVDVDRVRQLHTLFALEADGRSLPAASLSDGTLRFLCLAVLLADPTARGVICIEEPENGIHPAKMADMSNLLRDLAVDPKYPPGPDNPLRQVIVATHSPEFVQLQDPNDCLFASNPLVRDNGTRVRSLRCYPLEGTWRARRGTTPVGLITILHYLSAPRDSQLTLALDPAGRS